MNVATCPDRESLAQVLQGDFSAPDSVAILDHLANCERCVQVADEISMDDDLIVSIQNARNTADPKDSAELATVLSLAKRLGDDTRNELDPTVITTAESGNVSSDIDQRSSQTDLSFLDPAERPDEIGRLGEFRILQVLGRGGMGVVFRAEDTSLERIVALKIMLPGLKLTDSLRKRFLREAKAMAAVDHENVIEVFRVGESDGIPFVAMKCLEGQSLSDRIRDPRPIDQSEISRIGMEAAQGLAAVHARDLIHRDLKPDNLWIEKTGRVKILDFGLAAADDELNLTSDGAILGTPTYMSPEQANSRPLDHRSDLFSLGSLLYYAATGQAAFNGPGLTAVLIAVAKADYQPLSTSCPDLDSEFSDVITRLMSLKPEDRFQDANVASAAFETIHQRLSEGTSRQPKASRSRTPTIKTSWLAVVGLAAIVLLAGTIIKIRLGNGTLEIVMGDNDLPVEVDIQSRDEVWIVDPVDGKPVKVTADRTTNQLRINKDGFEVITKEFNLADNAGGRLHVRFVPLLTSQTQSPAANLSKTLLASDAEVDILRWIVANGGRVSTAYGLIESEDQVLDESPGEVTVWVWPEFTDEDLGKLSGISQLALLVLDQTTITGSGFEQLAESDSSLPLTINVFGCKSLISSNLKFLSKLPLVGFHAGETTLGDESIDVLRSLKGLTDVTCGEATTGAALKKPYRPQRTEDA